MLKNIFEYVIEKKNEKGCYSLLTFLWMIGIRGMSFLVFSWKISEKKNPAPIDVEKFFCVCYWKIKLKKGVTPFLHFCELATCMAFIFQGFGAKMSL